MSTEREQDQPIRAGADPTTDMEDPGPGIHVERRAVLGLSMVVACGALLGRALPAGQGVGAAPPGDAGALDDLAWSAFAPSWHALAEELRGSPADRDESYAAQLAGLIARVPLRELPALEEARTKGGGLHAGPSFFLLPCLTVEFRMDPGAVVRPHNHPPQVVMTLCAEGEARFRHLEVQDDAPPCTEIGASFLARETRSGLLRPGQSTSFTRLRDGIHGFTAGPQGARLIDFTVSLTADVETFSYVELADTPRDAERLVYEARWIGKR